MHYSSLLKTLTSLSLTVSILSLPLRPEQPVERVQLLRRVPYSVVAVDGGAAATSAALTPTKTVTLSASATKTVEKTKTLSASATASATTILVAPSTRKISEPGPTITVASTVTNDHTPKPPPAIPSQTSAHCETSFSPTSSAEAATTPSTVPPSSKTSTKVQTFTMTSVAYGYPPKPISQSYGASASYATSRSWNSTATSNYGPTDTAGSSIGLLPSSWTRIP